MTTSTADLWHHYGRARHVTDRAVPGDFRWDWDQSGGPGAEVLGDLAGAHIGDLGAGAARHAAHLAVHHRPGRVDAVDASPAQYAMATDLYGHLAPRLRVVRSDAVGHLHANPDSYDVLYGVFGAVDFTEPRALLPAAVAALRPGGRLVFSTLGHYRNGAPAQPDVRHADIPARTPEGGATTMRRWVLQERVWTELLDEAGFTRISVRVLPGGARGVGALLVSGFRSS